MVNRKGAKTSQFNALGYDQVIGYQLEQTLQKTLTLPERNPEFSGDLLCELSLISSHRRLLLGGEAKPSVVSIFCCGGRALNDLAREAS